ncbi:MAG: hypothetical protein E4G94_11645 [ANME-2 cluster archaeon]|nr:MAG: hypothetical protein E4G94_11645 [ANME-2 cluster archaeon]
MTALAGLDPVKRESGTSVKYQVKIIKNGREYTVRYSICLPFVPPYIIKK